MPGGCRETEVGEGQRDEMTEEQRSGRLESRKGRVVKTEGCRYGGIEGRERRKIDTELQMDRG